MTATVVTASCAEWDTRHEFTDERTTVVTMTVYREAGGFPGH